MSAGPAAAVIAALACTLVVSGAASSQQVAKIRPALFLRYGRFTITNASGFVTRRSDDVVRGLGIAFANDERLRVNLALL